MAFGLDRLFEVLTTGADISQFISLSKNIADEKLFAKILENQAKIIGFLENKKEINYMKIIKDLIEKMDDTLEEVECYADKAILLREEHKSLADTYNKVGEMHIQIYDILHKQVVSLIDENKKSGVQPPPEMLAIWNYEHEKLVEEFTKAKYKIEEYKKMGY